MRLGKPPAGYGHWTLKLLADEIVALEAFSRRHATSKRVDGTPHPALKRRATIKRRDATEMWSHRDQWNGNRSRSDHTTVAWRFNARSKMHPNQPRRVATL